MKADRPYMPHKNLSLSFASLIVLALASTAAVAQAPSLQQRIAAATATAQSTANVCNAGRPFYWEIGDGTARAASGSVMLPGSTVKVTAKTVFSIASASKWVYGSYIAQRSEGKLTDLDRQYLAMRSGFTQFRYCETKQSVDSCLAFQGNGEYTADTDGAFYYNGGHMQKHASMAGLGAMNIKALGIEMRRLLGTDIPMTFVQPQLAGGAAMSADGYARFLRKIMTGSLQMGALLGTGKVCTNPLTCGLDNARLTPSPVGESWSYSVGHWVEDDPLTGDGAFSSAGAFGFYPWIDASRTWYGVVSRQVPDGGPVSLACGQLIRQAWVSGVAR
jgi:hypothetical protein